MMEEFGEAFRSRLGVPGDPEVAVDVPKIVLLEDGVVRYDPDYHRKRRDWSYPTTEPGDPDGAAEPESKRRWLGVRTQRDASAAPDVTPPA